MGDCVSRGSLLSVFFCNVKIHAGTKDRKKCTYLTRAAQRSFIVTYNDVGRGFQGPRGSLIFYRIRSLV